MRLVLLALTLLVCSCKSSKKISNNVDLGLFTIEKQIDDDFLLISKKSSILKNHNDTEREPAYSLKTPTTLKKINSTISVIPNEIELMFNNRQKVLIYGNKNGIEVDKVSLSKELFLSELNTGYLSNKISSSELMKGRFFGIYANGEYILVYLNAKEKNLRLFNELLKSQETRSD